MNDPQDAGRAREEAYFHQREQELLEAARKKAEDARHRAAMGDVSGIQAPEVLEMLQHHGYDPDTIRVIPLVPLLGVAWADGSVSDAERQKIRAIARMRGIEVGSAADRRLEEFLLERPEAGVLERSILAIRSILAARPGGDDVGDDLLALCREVATASGGFLGIGSKVSQAEEALMTELARELAEKNPDAAAAAAKPR
jgi:hypothetical protein